MGLTVWVVFLGIVSMIICGKIAAKKHRNVVGWRFIGLFFGLIGIFAAYVSKPREPWNE